MRKKADLPTKTCATCGRPFAWRRKWARAWDEVKYCSDRCREVRPAKRNAVAETPSPPRKSPPQAAGSERPQE